MTNILKLNVLKLFNNLQIMQIWYVEDSPFSLYQLVSLLRHTKIRKVDIIPYFNNNTWLHYLWRDKSSSLIEAFKNKGYAIEFKGGYTLSIKLL